MHPDPGFGCEIKDLHNLNRNLNHNLAKLVKSRKAPLIVIPVKTGIQENHLLMGSRFRGSDGLGDFFRHHQF